MNSGYHSTTSQSEELNESERQEREKKTKENENSTCYYICGYLSIVNSPFI